jgi:hypothetical protein
MFVLVGRARPDSAGVPTWQDGAIQYKDFIAAMGLDAGPTVAPPPPPEALRSARTDSGAATGDDAAPR